MKKFSILAAFLLLVVSATWAMAGQRGEGDWYGGWCPDSYQLTALNLSPEQSEKIRALRESFLMEVTPLRSQAFTKKGELVLLWLQTSLDVPKIRATQKEILDLKAQIEAHRTDFRLAFRNLLTPEQTTQLLAQGIGMGPGGKRMKGKRGVYRGMDAGAGRGPDNAWRR